MKYILHVPIVLKAIKFAERAHKGQVRKVSGTPYFHHTLAVALMIISFKKSKKLTELVVAAILHDILEDTKITFEQITREFGSLVASLVLELTNDDEEIKRIGKKEYQQKKLLHMSSYALLIKLADRLHNMSEHPSEKMKADTKELMALLVTQRRNMTQSHYQLIAEIQKLC